MIAFVGQASNRLRHGSYLFAAIILTYLSDPAAAQVVRSQTQAIQSRQSTPLAVMVIGAPTECGHAPVTPWAEVSALTNWLAEECESILHHPLEQALLFIVVAEVYVYTKTCRRRKDRHSLTAEALKLAVNTGS